jgi:hypothetical protein
MYTGGGYEDGEDDFQEKEKVVPVAHTPLAVLARPQHAIGTVVFLLLPLFSYNHYLLFDFVFFYVLLCVVCRMFCIFSLQSI